MKIRVLSVDLEKKVTKNNPIDNPRGTSCYTLFVFKSSRLIKTSIGLSDFNPGDCILIDPSFPITSNANIMTLSMTPFLSKGQTLPD